MVDHHYYVRRGDPDQHHFHTGSETIWEVCSPADETVMLGGAARVAAAIVALGGTATCIGAVGKDALAGTVRRLLKKAGVQSHLIDATDRPTTLKLRIYHREPSPDESNILQRVDKEMRNPIPSEVADKIKTCIAAEIESADAIVLEDREKGVLTAPLVHYAILEALRRDIPVIAEPKFDWSKYRSLDIAGIIPNYVEFCRGGLGQFVPPDKMALPNRAQIEVALERWPNIRSWVITCERFGSSVVWQPDAVEFYRANWTHVEVIGALPHRVPGCGAAFTAAYALGYAAHNDALRAAQLATLVASCQARTDFSRTVTRVDIEKQVILPQAGRTEEVWSASLGRVAQAIGKIGDHHSVREVVPGVAADTTGQGQSLLARIRHLMASDGQFALLITGPQGSGKSYLAHELLESLKIEYEWESAPLIVSDIAGRLRKFLSSPSRLLVLDEFLAVEKEMLAATGALANGMLNLDREKVPLGAKKLLCLGASDGKQALSPDVARRFPEVVALSATSNSIDVVDIFSLNLTRELARTRHGNPDTLTTVSVDRQLLAAVAAKAQVEHLNAGPLAGIAAKIAAAHANRRESTIAAVDWTDAEMDAKWIELASKIVHLGTIRITVSRATLG